ncbi:kinase-like domain-containing protein [Piptocephalis cylindrospora]|uniref:Kinase-like domain-containing protein n=1 Tax=Piptocephalis cylindrospora TaxID=1907219 RepID=A0A4P9XY78_9FUNG|nr:kinase-like domain-containing protein [Piptocephalis cylindrospora]|eukprot:RKP11304.1 kinase-like domain-containing protein [Piptocephalis cylindrospora]
MSQQLSQPLRFQDLKCSSYLPSLQDYGMPAKPLLPDPKLFEGYSKAKLRAWSKCSRYIKSSAKGTGNGLFLPYKIQDVLGSGAFGQVYYGEWTGYGGADSTPIPVAIKKVPKFRGKDIPYSTKKLAQMFYREVTTTIAAYSVAPFGVIQPLDLHLDEHGHWFFILEKAQGNPLALRNDKVSLNKFHSVETIPGQPIPEAIVRAIYAQLIRALALLNKAHIIHWDVKDENMLYSCSGGSCNVKLIDFAGSTRVKSWLLFRSHSYTPAVFPYCVLTYTCPTSKYMRGIDVYTVIASIHRALSFPIAQFQQVDGSKRATLPKTKAETDLLSHYIQRDWTEGAFRIRPISKQLQHLFEAILPKHAWMDHPTTFSEIARDIHNWFTAPLEGMRDFSESRRKRQLS